MTKVPRMPRAERRRLIHLSHRCGDPETSLRLLIVAKLASGKNGCTVARELEVARSTVIRAIRRYLELGIAGLYDLRRNNGSTKADEEFRIRVAALLMGSPEDFGWQRPTWTRELLCLQMTRDGWPSVAVCTMGRALARIGARLGRPKPIVLCPWRRDARLQRLDEIRDLEASACRAEPVLYADEVDIHLNPKIGRDWMLRGHQRRIVTPGKNEKFYLAGALDVQSGELVTTGGLKKNAHLFCEFLRLLATTYSRARRIHVVLDNYRVHSAHRVTRTLDELRGRIVLHFLPPYCPDANRIERVWQDLHANVTRNHRCKTMRHLLENARLYLTNYIWRRSVRVAPIMRFAA
jgi:transposase